MYTARHSIFPPESRTVPVLALLLFAAVFALFSPTRHYSLVDLDDYAYIVQNRAVMQGLSPEAIREAFSPSNVGATMYMPVLWLSYMADVTFFGASFEHAAPFHLVNVALHACAAVLLFFILRRFRATPLWAFLLALLWAIHPLRVESVAWVTERKDTLSAVFGLSSTLAWIASTHPGRARFSRILLLGAAAILYAAGLLAKPSLVPLPLAWLAFDIWPLQRIPPSPKAVASLPSTRRVVAEKLLFLPVAIAAAWLAVAQHHNTSGVLDVPWGTRLSVVAPNFLFYLCKTFFPVHLSPLVPQRWDYPASTILLSLCLCPLFAAIVWACRRKCPSLLTGTAWTILFFLPASGLQPLPVNTVADRFFYLPAIGLSIALVSLSVRDGARLDAGMIRSGPAPFSLSPLSHRHTLALHVILALILLPLAFLASRLLPVWRNTETLYAHVHRTFPDHPVAASALAELFIRDHGDFSKADELVLPIMHNCPLAYLPRRAHAACLADSSPLAALDSLSGFPVPESLYDRIDYFSTVARLELAAGHPDRAIDTASKAMALDPAASPATAPARFLLVAAALDKRDSALALRFARQTRLFAGCTSVSLENALPYAIYQWEFGARKDAVHWFFRILDAFPGRTDLWNNILWGLATASWSPADPVEVLERTLRMQADSPVPEHPGILDTLAVAYANAGDFDSALRAIDRALAQIPDSGADFRERLLRRRNLFLAHQPYREKAFDRLFALAFGSPAEAL